MQRTEFPIQANLRTSIKSHLLDANGVICIVLLHNWKWLKRGKFPQKQIESLFSVIKKKTAFRETHAHTHVHKYTHTRVYFCVSVFPPLFSHFVLSVSCLLCICGTKTSKWIRITDSSPSTVVTDLAYYFNAWQNIFLLLHPLLSSTLPCTCCRQWAATEGDNHNIYWFITVTVMIRQTQIFLVQFISSVVES